MKCDHALTKLFICLYFSGLSKEDHDLQNQLLEKEEKERTGKINVKLGGN